MDFNNGILIVILVTSLATFLSRFLGVLTSEKVSAKSEIFHWFNYVAYGTLAALLARMIVFPAGVLASAELFIRLTVLVICLVLFLITKKKFSFTYSIFCYTFRNSK